MPSPVSAETMKVASNLAVAFSVSTSDSSAGLSTRSILLSTRTFGCFTAGRFARIPSASSSIPLLASISSTTMSASCAPLQAVATIARSSLRRGAKMPGVSMNTSCAFPCMAIPRTSARVVCTLRLTILTLEPTSALVSVDLPAFGAPISAMKPQRRSASAIRRVHTHAFARQHRGSGSLLGGALGAAHPFGRLQCRHIDRDTEFRIVMRPPALHLAVRGRRQAAPLRPFLQHRFRIAQRPHRREHALAPEPLDQRGRRRITAIDEHRADQRPPAIGGRRHAPPPARVRFRAAETQRRAEIERARDIRAGLAPHQIGQAARQLAFVALGKCAVEHVGNGKTEHVVAKEFQPLVTATASLLRGGRRNVRQRAVKDRLVGKRVADPPLELLARLGALCLAAHRTIVNSLSQRTTHGQRHTFQAASPSPTEKKMISARPTILSIGT